MAPRLNLDADAVESLGHVAGVIAATVGLAGVALAIGLSGEFSLREQALSELGATGASTAWLFNGTLVLAGFLAMLFCASLIARLRHVFQRAGVGLLGLAAASLVGVGLFPTGNPLHLPFAVGFFVLLTVGLLLTGYGDREADRPRRSRISLNLAVLHLLAWSFGFLTLEGVALPELVGGVIFAVWIIIVVIQRGRALPVPVME